MEKKLPVIVLCSVIAGIGLAIYNSSEPRHVHPKSEKAKESAGTTDASPLSVFSDEDLMKESS